ncbi:MAG: hypothetical protein QM718_06370 [Steroidobacteraceae bacterium]
MTANSLRVGGFVTLLLAAAPLLAQVSQPTEADKNKVPMQFRPDDQKGAGAPNFAPRGTPAGYTPDPNPREFSGSYVSGGGGGPPGGGGPAGGAPGGAGPAAGGAPPGGGGAPGAGGPPGGGGAPGGASGGTPGGAPGGTPGGAAGAGSSCTPTFGSGAYATHVIYSPALLVVVGEENHRIRRIVIGGQLPKQPKPIYSGYSVGRWEGNTLVVDTIAIRGRDGQHLVERWTRQANGSIDIQTQTLDAAGKAQGAASSSTLVWRPDLSFVENICEDFGEAFGSDYGGGKK